MSEEQISKLVDEGGLDRSEATIADQIRAAQAAVASWPDGVRLAMGLPARGTQPRFELLSEAGDVVRDGGAIVRDTTTRLEWTREPVSAKRLTWTKADAACKELRLGGHDDWRLPTRVELFMLVDETRFDPAIDPVFQCGPNWFWTSTPYAPSPGDYAWGVIFRNGYAIWGYRGGSGFGRAVRASQS